MEPVPWTSADGVHWVEAATATPFGPGARVMGMASRGGRVVGIGVVETVGGDWVGSSTFEPAVWVSDDGIAWSRLPALPAAPAIPTDSWGAGYRTIVADDSGWLLLTLFSQAWTSTDGLTWKPADNWPHVFGGYLPGLVGLGNDLIGIGPATATPDLVAIGTIERP